MAIIPIAEVARIEPRSCFLDPTCSTDMCFMFSPHFIADFRLPIADLCELSESAQIGNWQSAIGNQ
jgi:hypothetical protein